MSNSRTKIGVLEKYKLEGMRKIWKMYTFQVTKMYFLQFKDDMRKPHDQLFLSQVTKIVLPAKGGASFPFEVHFRAKGSPWLLNAASNDDRIKWMECIQPGSSKSLQQVTRADVPPTATAPENPYVVSPTSPRQQQFQLSPTHAGATQDNRPPSPRPRSPMFRETAQRGSNRDVDLTQSWPQSKPYQEEPQEYLMPMPSPEPEPMEVQSLPVGMTTQYPGQQNAANPAAAFPKRSTYSHAPRPRERPPMSRAPTSPEVYEPVEGRFAAAMPTQYRPQPVPRRTAQPNQRSQSQGQRYPPPLQSKSNGHYDRPPPNPRPAYPQGQTYMPLQPAQAPASEDNQYVVIVDNKPRSPTQPDPRTNAESQSQYMPLQPTPPATEGDQYMTLVGERPRPQPRPRAAPRRQPPQSQMPHHYMTLEGELPAHSDRHTHPSSGNHSQSPLDTQRNYVMPDLPELATVTIDDHEYVDLDGTGRSTTSAIDERNYIDPNPGPMVDSRNYVPSDSNPLIAQGNYVDPNPAGPLVDQRNYVIPDSGPYSPVDEQNYIHPGAIDSQPQPRPREAAVPTPPSPRPRVGKPRTNSGTASSAQDFKFDKMMETFSPSQVEMLVQMLQKVQLQTQTQKDVEAAWALPTDVKDNGSPSRPLYDSRAPGAVPQYELDEDHTRQRNLQRLTRCLSHTPVLAENILVTDEDDPDSYEARPEWAKAITVPQDSAGSDLDTLAALEQEALFIPRDQLDNFEQIGEGQFGKVFKASLSRGEQCTPVAVKTSKKSTSEAEKASFLKEMSVMSQMMHPNIVRLYGLVQEDVPAPWIVLEYLPHGDLKKFLMKNKRPVQQLVKYMIDVAMGMHYISERGLIHRDLAARNILVGDNELCKVADFGLLRELPKDDSIYHSQTNIPCPIRWMPPESISDRQFSTASDVWSFGILIWEMFNPGKLPYEKLGNFECVTKVAQGYRIPSPRGCPPLLARIMKACWHEKPDKRPSFLLISTLLSTKVTFDK